MGEEARISHRVSEFLESRGFLPAINSKSKISFNWKCVIEESRMAANYVGNNSSEFTLKICGKRNMHILLKQLSGKYCNKKILIPN